MSTPIRDLQNAIIGYQDDDGAVRDKHQKKIGFIHRDGVVLDSHKEQVGNINARGEVFDRYGRQVGSIDDEGNVQDWHGVQVYSGSVAPLLLDFEKKRKTHYRVVSIWIARRVNHLKSKRRAHLLLFCLKDSFRLR